ncbi:MAG: glycosyltransferase family 4 protein [Thiobacillus sp.]|nr:glycosyltransferase family 4 protein [Thiobacillus sp.]
MRPEGDTGVQTHFRTFMAYLHKIGRQGDLITPYNAPLWQVYPAFGLRKLVNMFSRELGVWWYRYWHAYFLKQALKHRLQTDAACVVYAQCPLSAQAALRARVSTKQRVVMVAHFNISQADEWAGKGLIQNGGRLYCAIQDVEADVLPRLDGLVFVSDFMRRELVGRIPAITKVAAELVPNFLPDPGMPVVQTVAADLINIGTLEARKNQHYLLDIVAALHVLGRPLTLTLVGDGPDRRALEDKVRDLRLSKQVRFAGYVSNAAEQIGLHRAYIHVATMESFGITLIEAMARGRPVFAAPVGGIPEVLGDSASGLALPLNDAKSAARIVADAMANADWMAAAGLAARERFLGEYVSDVAARRLTQFLDKKSGKCNEGAGAIDSA